MIKITDIKVNSEELQVRVSKPQGVYLPIHINTTAYKQPLQVILKKPRYGDWLVDSISSSSYSISDELSSPEYMHIVDSIFKYNEILEILFEWDKIEETEYARIDKDTSDSLHLTGQRIWKKINDHIDCGFTMKDGEFVFIIPYESSDIKNAISINFAEIMVNYSNENEFVAHAVSALQALEKRHKNAS